MTEAAHRSLTGLGHCVTVTDLYQSSFDPAERGSHYARRVNQGAFAALAEQRHAWNTNGLPEDVTAEIENLNQADLIILQFPLWWHGPPAILKGWMDRVFVNGGLYTSRMRYGSGFFRGKRALVSVTTGAPRNAFGPGCRGGDFDTMLWPIHYSLHYMGFSVMPAFVSYGVQGHGYTYEEPDVLQRRLRSNLSEWADYLADLEDKGSLTFPDWKDWDSDGRAVGTDRSAEPAPA